jgi:hypothetical protein
MALIRALSVAPMCPFKRPAGKVPDFIDAGP